MRFFAHRPRFGVRRQIRIEETECVRRLDHADTGGALLLHNLITKRLHPGPMNLRPKMMFGVVTVVKPGPIVELVVTAYTPGERLVRIAAIVPVIPVQVGKAVTEVLKRKEETDVAPVEYAKNDEGRDEKREFQDTPECLAWILAFQLLENRLGIFAEEAEEGVFERVLRVSVVAMLVNRNPVHRLSVFVGQIRIALVMLHVDAFVKDLAETDRDRLQDAEQSI